MTQRQIEITAKKLANVRRSMGRGMTARIESRFDNLNAIIEKLPLGQQIAISLIANQNDD